MLSNIAISGSQVNFGITIWKFILRIRLALGMGAIGEKDSDKAQSQERAYENHVSVMKGKISICFSQSCFI